VARAAGAAIGGPPVDTRPRRSSSLLGVRPL
jgi:hypothetical protein